MGGKRNTKYQLSYSFDSLIKRRKSYKVLLLIIVPLTITKCIYAQNATFNIRGIVINAEDSTPLSHAIVYLSNTTFGTTTSEDGSFYLNDIPSAQYDLVVSYLGFKGTAVQVNTLSAENIRIALSPDTSKLKEVVVTFNKDWNKNYTLFRKYFLGQDDNAVKCEILNPQTLLFTYDSNSTLLTAHAQEPLIIVNKMLGYKIYYQLKFFQLDLSKNRTTYLGYPHFEELKAKNKSQLQSWERERKTAYLGSLNHFLRALYLKQLWEQGFVVKRLSIAKKRNISNKEIQDEWTGDEYRSVDTLFIRQDKANKNSDIYTIYPENIAYDDIFHKQDQKSYGAISFSNSLYVTYIKAREDYNYITIRHPDDYDNYAPAYQSSILSMRSSQVTLYKNGNLNDPLGIMTEGYWSYKQVADLLPLDYNPK